ncbi:hypothetical protein GOP47_0014615 [Adiantum capillus-veneris]|uniref:Uncharacterized protein n=1 Tax=Adiantum capillus-veneris TaxID=13818 RepID=A0A9D4UMN3_ADICA|nr:hypothetical protein GOP47_0014615 [Adiantum capillus-veneris]
MAMHRPITPVDLYCRQGQWTADKYQDEHRSDGMLPSAKGRGPGDVQKERGRKRGPGGSVLNIRDSHL